ncbi:hypothetical protein [Microcoleus sp. Pol12B5]|uniref:hypothetical protein n=1 Tax=Microcoleus sp. Pol12B5 TaxID=3055396 RepID=UPI002FD1F136
MKRENDRRGDRLSSQIYEEVVRYFKRSPPKEGESQENSKAVVTVIIFRRLIY